MLSSIFFIVLLIPFVRLRTRKTLIPTAFLDAGKRSPGLVYAVIERRALFGCTMASKEMVAFREQGSALG
jgi:hypothetical protein